MNVETTGRDDRQPRCIDEKESNRALYRLFTLAKRVPTFFARQKLTE